MQQSYIFHVDNMHCQACVLLTESELKEHPNVLSAKSNLATLSVEITGDFGTLTPQEIADELTKKLSQHKLSIDKIKTKKTWHEFYIATPIAFTTIALFILLQKFGVVNLVQIEEVTYGAAFIIGIVASLSTCMAVVGGLVLSMSATFAQKENSLKPHILFHIGRIFSFFILGGVIGLIGSTFQPGQFGTFILGLLVGIVMLLLGLNLLNIFHWTKKIQPTIPKKLSEHALRVTKLQHTLTPALVGVITFFLPCGFTQSMQLYALSTGSFLQSALIMLFFALGTFPVLGLMSFSSLRINNHPKSGIFFKTIGLIVILFAIFNIINSLAAAGFITPIFSF